MSSPTRASVASAPVCSGRMTKWHLLRGFEPACTRGRPPAWGASDRLPRVL